MKKHVHMKNKGNAEAGQEQRLQHHFEFRAPSFYSQAFQGHPESLEKHWPQVYFRRSPPGIWRSNSSFGLAEPTVTAHTQPNTNTQTPTCTQVEVTAFFLFGADLDSTTIGNVATYSNFVNLRAPEMRALHSNYLNHARAAARPPHVVRRRPTTEQPRAETKQDALRHGLPTR